MIDAKNQKTKLNYDTSIKKLKKVVLNDCGTLITIIVKAKAVQVILQPVTSKLDDNTLRILAKDISKQFENKATVSVGKTLNVQADPQFQSAFDSNRNQWDSFKLLELILDNFKPTRGTKILGIFDVNAYSDGFDFVFGEAFYRGRVAVVYVSRLKQEYYGLRPNRTLFYERLVKEAGT